MIHHGTFLEVDSQDPRDSYDQVAAAEQGGAPNMVISKSMKAEGREGFGPGVPNNRILLRQEMVSVVFFGWGLLDTRGDGG